MEKSGSMVGKRTTASQTKTKKSFGLVMSQIRGSQSGVLPGFGQRYLDQILSESKPKRYW